MPHYFFEDWIKTHTVLALRALLVSTALLTQAQAGNYMTASLLIKLSTSDDVSKRALAAGYVAAIHDELAGKALDDPACFFVPQSVDMEELVDRTVHFIDWFAHEFKGWSRDQDSLYPAKELVHLGLVQHFPCEST